MIFPVPDRMVPASVWKQIEIGLPAAPVRYLVELEREEMARLSHALSFTTRRLLTWLCATMTD